MVFDEPDAAPVPDRASVLRAAWLADDLLLVVCRLASERGERPPETTTVEVEGRRVGWDEQREGDRPPLAVHAAELTPGGLAAAAGVLALRRDGETVVCEADAVREALTDLRTLAREQFAAWSPPRREHLLAGLSSLGRPRLSPSLSEGLFTLREALRERRPLSVVDPAAERVVEVERLHRLDDTGFYVRGWLWEASGRVARLDVVSPEGERVGILDRSVLHPRPDATPLLGRREEDQGCRPWGFLSHFSTTASSHRADGWVVELVDATGRGVETRATATSSDSDAAEDAIVADVDLATGEHAAVLERHVRPALAHLAAARQGRVEPTSCDHHGEGPTDPEVSIVVALDRRIELLEHQLAQFADDPDVHGCELVYVLCDPDEGERLRELAAGLFELYGLPFRVLLPGAPAGPGLAANLGAQSASGARLLLLGPSVIPEERGWLETLRRFYLATPDIGALSPKLLYEDDLIERAGLELVENRCGGGWKVHARYRGLHRDLTAASVARPLPAVAPDCLMVGVQAFSHLGGLSCDYLTSAYQGADLCLRLRETGLESWYLPQVAMYTLEDHSQGTEADAARERHDRWLLSQRHGRAIRELVGPARPGTAVPVRS